jgi:hypothetical protein
VLGFGLSAIALEDDGFEGIDPFFEPFEGAVHILNNLEVVGFGTGIDAIAIGVGIAEDAGQLKEGIAEDGEANDDEDDEDRDH